MNSVAIFVRIEILYYEFIRDPGGCPLLHQPFGPFIYQTVVDATVNKMTKGNNRFLWKQALKTHDNLININRTPPC